MPKDGFSSMSLRDSVLGALETIRKHRGLKSIPQTVALLAFEEYERRGWLDSEGLKDDALPEGVRELYEKVKEVSTDATVQ